MTDGDSTAPPAEGLEPNLDDRSIEPAVLDRDPAVELTGEWQFRTDPDDEGRAAGWYDPDADWDDATTVSVPHSWQERDEWRDYTGTAWYRRTVTVEDPGDDRAVLAFGAVDHETDVWVDGEHAGHNEGGYLPFTVDAMDALEPGEHTVVLRVHDPEDMSEILHGKQGDPWYTRVSGPWQRIDLVTVPETRVERAAVTPDLDDDTATVDVAVGTGAVSEDGDGPDTLAATVTVAREGRTVAETTVPVEAGTASATLSIPDPEYWTPETPALYDVTVALTDDATEVDTYETYFGMRSVDVVDGETRLNGEPFEMRGALDQAFYPDTFYRPADLATFEDEIRAAKELNLNLLRKHIKPAHPRFVELADRMGILVWQEPANPKRYTEASKRRLREQLRGLIERDYNSPSTIAWSIYNEEWGIGSGEDEEPLWTDPDKQDFLEACYEETRRWDPTRLLCDNSGWAHVATDLNDYHEYFVAPDRVDAWRDRLDEMVADPGGNYGDARTDPEAAPLLVSEFGTWGLSSVSRLIDHYDGDPHWFDHPFLDGLKRPGDVRARFEEDPVSGAFDSLDDLATAWQRREFESVERIIADMRAHEGVDGYVITELTDIEWEFNGILDYLREEKSFHDEFARVNAPVSVDLALDSHVAWSGDAVTGDVVAVNDTAERVETTVSWRAGETGGEVDLSVPAHGIAHAEGAVSFDAPAVDDLAAIEVSVATAEWTTTETVYVAPRDGPAADGGTPPETVYAAEADLRDALAARGHTVVSDSDAAAVSVVTDLAAVDGPTLVVPDRDGAMEPSERVEYRDLPERESWNLCASFLYQTLLESVDRVPGWAFEDLYPYGYVTDLDDADDVGVGYTEGWLENSGAVVTLRDGGSTGICTLRVTDQYGEHPVASVVVDRLLSALS